MDKIIFFDGSERPCFIRSDLILALTPVACYQLDKINVSYKMPTDYMYPRVVEPVDFEIPVFNLILSETKQTEDYWQRLIDCFNGYEIKYYGTEFKVLKRLLDKGKEKEALIIGKECYKAFGGGVG